jgi:hypothetical protein
MGGMISLTLLLPLLAPTPLQEPAVEVAPVVLSAAELRFESLMAEFDMASQDWMAEVQALIAEAEESGVELTEYPPQPGSEFIPRFMAAAKEFEGSDDAVPFLMFAVQQGLGQPDSQGFEALQTLLAVHIKSEKLDPLGSMLGYLAYMIEEPEALRIIAKCEKEAGSANLRAWAKFARLKPIFANHAPSSEAFLAAKKEMLAALAKTNDPMLRGSFDSEVTVFEKFGLGMLAPDIIGPDLDGTEFKLSDYKGKVVFLDFWGDW